MSESASKRKGRHPTGGLISLLEARRFVFESLDVLGEELVTLGRALGRVSAREVRSSFDIPPFANSAMDGYAVRSADVQLHSVELGVLDEVLAGFEAQRPLGEGEAIRIMTGAPMPDLADAVVPVEKSEVRDGGMRVFLHGPAPPGSNVRCPGEDIRAGDVVLGESRVITPLLVGVLASVGVTRVLVRRSPVVGVLSTGDELIGYQEADAESRADLDGADTAPPRGKIHDSNRPSLLAMVRQAGFEGVDLGAVRDDPDAITEAICEGSERCDALVTSGGVSVGDVDFVKLVLDKLGGGTMRWMQVATKPAKPFAFGRVADGRVPVFGLAGNPVSSAVGFELYVRPALRRMAGYPSPDRPVLHATARSDIRRPRDGKLHLVRVSADLEDGLLGVRPLAGQASHMLLTTANADALALVPDGEGVPAGGDVDILLLDAPFGDTFASWQTTVRQRSMEDALMHAS